MSRMWCTLHCNFPKIRMKTTGYIIRLTSLFLMIYLCYKGPHPCSVCHSHTLILSLLFMTYHQICNQCNTTGETGGEGTSYPSITFVLLVQCLFVCVVFSRLLFVFLSVFCLSLCCFRFTPSEYPFGVLKLLLLGTVLGGL